MYSPNNQPTTIEEKISSFIEGKAKRSAWDSVRKTVAEWRHPNNNVTRDLHYEQTLWSVGKLAPRLSDRKVSS